MEFYMQKNKENNYNDTQNAIYSKVCKKSGWKNYYNATKNVKPHANVVNFLKLNIKPSMAIDLGCGAGRDTIALIKHNWNVLSIDKEDTETIIKEQLTKEEQEKFKFKKTLYGDMKLPKTDLIVANFSLPFCKKENFGFVWRKINEALAKGGYFVGTFFGLNDSWAKGKKNLVFLSESEVKKLFTNYELIQFNEIEKDSKTASGEEKHWHIYDVIAKK